MATAGVSPATATSGRSALGQWNSAVTSYYVLAGATALLLVLGLVMVLSSSSVDSLAAGHSPYAEFLDQTKYALVGLPVMLVLARLPVRALKRLAWPALLLGVGFQLLVFTPFGWGTNGNRNWVRLPGFQAQPSEVLKLALALWLGVVLARKLPLLSQWKHALIPAIPVAAGAIGLVLLGHDLGTVLVLFLLVFGALWVAGVRLRMFVVPAVAVAAVTFPLVYYSGNRKDRINSWLAGDAADALNGGYQSQHGIWALGTGGWGGLGLGQSREKWSYLPEAHNDFVFAVIGEELGLLGTLLVLVLFALLAFAMVRVIRRHDDAFARITTGAILCWIVGQALVNIAVVIHLLPVIGVPLPLVSAGGSALIMTMAALGVVLAFARSEPGAADALAARPSVFRRSLAVLGRARG
ncbi:MAG TPA: putative lipid II flippase FtsW [Rugosimonospora sp.]|nr:putative lipid II flippase FtsW [Rugosimonospora sp.]